MAEEVIPMSSHSWGVMLGEKGDVSSSSNPIKSLQSWVSFNVLTVVWVMPFRMDRGGRRIEFSRLIARIRGNL